MSASFDKSVKLWDGIKGTFVATFTGHVGAVYQVAWSADSRLVVSGSKDSTLKVCKPPYNVIISPLQPCASLGSCYIAAVMSTIGMFGEILSDEECESFAR